MELPLEVEFTDVENDYKEGSLTEKFHYTRNLTLEIVKPLAVEDYVIQTEYFMSPPRWHIGHTTWFYDQLLKKFNPDYKPYKDDYSFYYNSYYLTFGKLFNKGKRGTLSRPTVEETFQYWNFVNAEADKFLSGNDVNAEAIKMFELAYNHEFQHQELMVYDMQHLLQEKYKPHTNLELPYKMNGTKFNKGMVKIKGGLYEMGYAGNDFSYDIERPLHKVYLHDYMIDNAPVTNGDFLEFVKDGGYDNFRLWLSEGWDTIKNNEWDSPMYWQKDENGKWLKYDFGGKRYIEDIANEPVVNVSYFEADAYAKWAGKRLPTEAEWEKAASWDEDTGTNRMFPWGDNADDGSYSNMLESRIWAPAPLGSYPKGVSYYGCYGMIGDCWEWTQSEFMPYPNFKSGFAEYNDKWFNNQKVLRGGSFGTPRHSTRNTYRNFFKTNERWLISGFRCAKYC